MNIKKSENYEILSGENHKSQRPTDERSLVNHNNND